MRGLPSFLRRITIRSLGTKNALKIKYEPIRLNDGGFNWPGIKGDGPEGRPKKKN